MLTLPCIYFSLNPTCLQPFHVTLYIVHYAYIMNKLLLSAYTDDSCVVVILAQCSLQTQL